MLWKIRLKKRITQKKMSKFLKITQSYLCKLEKFNVLPSLTLLVEISQKLDICLLDLLVEYCLKNCKCKCNKCNVKKLSYKKHKFNKNKKNALIQIVATKKLLKQIQADARYKNTTVSDLIINIIKEHYKESKD